MSLLAHLVARNEGARYLDAVLSALPTPYAHLYDDRSTDDTVGIAQRYGVVVGSREAGEPTFLEDEGAFRQAAWDSFESWLMPQAGDWVLAIDCDEMLVADGDVAASLDEAIGVAERIDAVGVDLPIPEVWEFINGEPWQRLDGYWAMLSAPRLFAYRPGGRFAGRAMACGSVPTYVTMGQVSSNACGLALAHLGYVDPQDRIEKYNRYNGVAGHGSAHVASIRSAAQLGSVTWSLPPVWRGSR